ncbi:MULTISPECIES: CocE/NonD family hydrolase [unclassified Neorhizobium]|uniref:CocE/NonD family hydrolase n=1 Tax=unclassified Neorhizobium TaxID=2629175 RepID=UPI001FF60105|nr:MULTISPECIES: CocE/NonD family hydrolase [unclassified Neorhizobium]MCJ9668796.1 CocE/NonD family hydrolase [Neorhizobium sp. SHOUNA12B]MCJ9744602.1 CocE/NonD family hydrolase [Neorhizobium sp. SHOUNA12A]
MSPASYGVSGPERGELLLDDGVVLVSDIYRPVGEGTFPVLLMRQPYGRAIASTLVLAHPSWYASHGYIVVIQDVRGCGDSGGVFEAFVSEIADGARTLEWAAALPGSNGKLGLYGFSYQAVTQYFAIAGKGSVRPDAIAPAMGSWMPRDDWAYEGTAFRLGLNAGWAAQMARLTAARREDARTYGAIGAVTDEAALRYLLVSRPDISHLAKWVADEKDYWDAVSPGALLADDPLDIPVLHTGGWADFLLQGTWAADAAFRAKHPDSTHLVIGCWAHAPWNRAGGASDMGAGAELSIDRAQLAFFDFYLKGFGEKPQPVRLFDMGRRRWLDLAGRPVSSEAEFFLSSSGLGAAMVSDGSLSMESGAQARDTFVHDPTRPTPLVGGHLGTPVGFADRSNHDNRADVAVYTTAPFDAARFFVGEASAEIEVETQSEGFDLCATLSLVAPSGEARVLSTGYARFAGGGRVSTRISLRPICVTVSEGFALRLSLQGAGTPVFEVHPGNGPFASVPEMARRPITISICHGGTTRSRLIMPEATDHVA